MKKRPDGMGLGAKGGQRRMDMVKVLNAHVWKRYNETHYLHSKYTVIKLSKNETEIKLLDQDHRQDEARQILMDARPLWGGRASS